MDPGEHMSQPPQTPCLGQKGMTRRGPSCLGQGLVLRKQQMRSKREGQGAWASLEARVGKDRERQVR